MADSGWKRTRVYVVVSSILASVLAAAAFTNVVAPALPRWLSWLPILGGILRTCVPAWVCWGVEFYCASALFVIAFQGWRERKKVREQERLAELRNLTRFSTWVCREAEFCFGPPEKRDRGHHFKDFRGALDEFTGALVQAREYEHRARLYNILSNMTAQCLADPNAVSWEKLQPFLALLKEWSEYVGRELNPETPPRPRDPFAPEP